MIELWTDGSCPANPGPGGWAVVVAEDGEVVAKLHGGNEDTTNNRMEMLAVIEAMRFQRKEYPGEKVKIVCDSEYVVKGTTEWMQRWKERKWNKTGGPIKNLDMWKVIEQLYKPTVHEMEWTRGHVGTEMNELADHLASLGSKSASGREVEDPADAFFL